MCVQLSAQGATGNYPVNKIGNKVKHLLLKLLKTHGNNTFMVYSEKEKRLKVATFTNDAKKVKELLQYDVKDRRNRHVSLLLRDISVIPFHTFRGEIFMWLSQNQIFLTKTIFRRTKEFIQCLGHITNMNPTQVDRVAYQELINDLLAGVAQEKVDENEQF
eukprot:11109926-Ditylum_brightwellii.AAC.1